MKKLLFIISLFVLVGGLSASENSRDTTINIYGIGAKTDDNVSAKGGAGIMYDSENVKLKLEGTSDFFKAGLVLKFNPFYKNLYFKIGTNALNEKVYAPDSSTARVNQYSGAFATGYMLMDDLYSEIGASVTKLNGANIGTSYTMKDETTRQGYIELAKRWNIASMIFDTTANTAKVDYQYKKDETSYGAGAYLYPTRNSKLSYGYQYEKDNIVNTYSVQYSLLSASYINNISQKTYKVTVGLNIAFEDITDFSTYGIPKNIVSHLSELNRFEDVVLTDNMNLQSSGGVEQKANSNSPTISMATQNINDNGGFITTDLPAPTVTNVRSGAVYSIIADPTGGKLTINSATGVATWNGNIGGNQSYSITIKVTNTDSTTASTTFTLNVTDNL